MVKDHGRPLSRFTPCCSRLHKLPAYWDQRLVSPWYHPQLFTTNSSSSPKPMFSTNSTPSPNFLPQSPSTQRLQPSILYPIRFEVATHLHSATSDTSISKSRTCLTPTVGSLRAGPRLIWIRLTSACGNLQAGDQFDLDSPHICIWQPSNLDPC